MLSELCRELNNWFEPRDKHGKKSGRKFGKFTISNGTIKVDGLQDGQYFRICGSVFNDGVYKYPAKDLKDETFDGSIWAMNVPKEVIDLDTEIDTWKEKYTDILNSPYQSESFGGYSYTKATASQGNAGGTGVTWQSAFADRLSHWRKV